jgi:hypothetical protein
MTKSSRLVLTSVGGAAGAVALLAAGLVVFGKSSGRASPRPAMASAPAREASEAPPAATPPAIPSPVPTAPVLDMNERLEAMAAARDYAGLSTLLFDEASTLGPFERADAVEWLGARRASPNFPALFLTARLHEAGGDLDSAAYAYVAASVLGRIDATRCSDLSAAGAVTAMESQFDRVRAHLRGNMDLARDAMRRALTMDEALRDRPPAAWIASYGLDAMNGKPVKFDPDADWLKERERIRRSLAKSIGLPR